MTNADWEVPGLGAVEGYIELRGVYDGWSIAKMRDGTYHNRWPPEDSRHAPTQRVIEQLMAADAAQAAEGNTDG